MAQGEGATGLVAFAGPLARLIKGLGSSNRFVNFRRIRASHTTGHLASQSQSLVCCVSDVTAVVVLPVLRTILLQPHYLPGCESTFYILDW